ncbi:MAG: RIP metalloprotease RseP [bacterium]
MEAFLIKLLAFIVAVGILVAVHEFGHFWVARKLGVRVLRFSIGFGKPLLSWQGKPEEEAPGPEYVIAAVPLGGYVKMLDEREGHVDESEVHRAFNRQSLPVRSAIVVAGPLFNFIFAIFAFWGVLVLGESGIRPLVGEVFEDSLAAEIGFQAGDEVIAINGNATQTWSRALFEYASAVASGEVTRFSVTAEDGSTRELVLAADRVGDLAEVNEPLSHLGVKPDLPQIPPVFGEILPDEAAASAGLRTGDRVLNANGIVIDDWVSWVELVREHPGKLIKLEIERDGETMLLDLIPASLEGDDRTIGRIGAGYQPVPGLLDRYRVQYSWPPLAAIPEAFEQSWNFSVLTLKVMWRIITGEASVKNLGGPITIADAAGTAATIGFVAFLKLMAIISISLGVLNLLPVPVLDGGHLVYFAIEGITGKPLSEAVLLKAQQIGMALLFALMGFVIIQDITRLMN